MLHQSINFLHQSVDIFSERLPVLNPLQLLAEKVDGLEEQIKQLRPQTFRYHIHGFVPDDGKHILGPVGNGHQGIVLHHGGRALDGVHDAENGVDILLGKAILLLGRQHNAVKLLQQGVGLI